MMLGSRWAPGYQEAFIEFLSSVESNHEYIFNQPELEKKEPVVKAPVVPAKPQKEKALKANKKTIPKEAKKPGRPSKVSTTKANEPEEQSHASTLKSDEGTERKSDEITGKQTNKIGLSSEITRMKMETNDFATKCPFCNFWKLNTDIEEHIKNCTSSTSSVSVPLESFYRAVENMNGNNFDESISPKGVKYSEKKKSSSSFSKNNEKSITDSTKGSAKKSKGTKGRGSAEKEVDLREFYFERPKRKAHDAALQSCKDILTEEANSKSEDYNFYKKFRKNSGDLNNTKTTNISKEQCSTIPSDSNPTGNLDGDDDVAQLANDLIKNWDTKEMMKEVYEMSPSVLQSMAQFENIAKLEESIASVVGGVNTKRMNFNQELSENTTDKGFEVFRINGGHGMGNDEKRYADSATNSCASPLHSCKECNFSTYSEVALNTHSIIYH